MTPLQQQAGASNPGSSGSTSQGSQQNVRATLTGPAQSNGEWAGTPTVSVAFNFNPKGITLSHQINLKEQGAALGGGANINVTLDQLGMPSLKLEDTIFDGPDTLANCEQLLAWSYALPIQNSKNTKPAAPVLNFRWGQFTVMQQSTIVVTMVSVTIKYERFDSASAGKPIRASVGLNLQPQAATSPPQTNPTSGGLAGRSGHLMTSGETLQGLALTAYGAPGRWRPLAEANGLDDPLRVHPGALLYLPSKDELPDGDAA